MAVTLSVVYRYNWLKKWLIPCVDEEPLFLTDGHVYDMISFFQIAFYIYTIYHDLTTDQYLWYVCENYTIYDKKIQSVARFSTVDEVLWAVAATWPRPPPLR